MALGYDDKSLAPPPSAPGLAFWTRAYGAWGDFDGNRNAATADRDLGGFVSGIDARVGGTWRLGLGGGLFAIESQCRAATARPTWRASISPATPAAWPGRFALRGGGAWTWNDIDTSRAVIFPGFFEREKASYDADTGQLFGEVAYPIAHGPHRARALRRASPLSASTPTASRRTARLRRSAAASIRDVGYSTLGLRAAATMTGTARRVTPHVSAAWQHAFDDVTPDAALAFASTGIGFTVTGVPLAEDTALIEAGLDLNLSPTATARRLLFRPVRRRRRGQCGQRPLHLAVLVNHCPFQKFRLAWICIVART